MPSGIYPRVEFHKRINSQCHKGIIAGMKGKTHSPEARIKISLSGFGRKQSEKTKKLRGIYRNGANHQSWKGGIKIKIVGYILQISKNHPYADSCGYVRQHRLVVENIIGRHLSRHEEVHHIGITYPIKSKENKGDNRPQNLIAFANKFAHRKFEKGKDVEPEEIIFDGRNYKQGGRNE